MKTKQNKNYISQKQGVLRYLKNTKSGITALKAFYLFQTMRLSAVIYDLKKDGYNIKTVLIQDSKTKKHFAKYSLITDEKPNNTKNNTKRFVTTFKHSDF